VISSHVGRQQTPATMHAHLLNRPQHCIATDLVQAIGSLSISSVSKATRAGSASRIGVPAALCRRSTEPDMPPCRWPP
jgi:hypothetical protein